MRLTIRTRHIHMPRESQFFIGSTTVQAKFRHGRDKHCGVARRAQQRDGIPMAVRHLDEAQPEHAAIPQLD
ncbi:hypothetical protein FY534_05400 [Alicyclobacillus sp. TC]|uniref:hypothetical protein n=1 Tax=Alicyclobacillus TaxID=29330 RepID=UPI000934A49E|nr:MULTISPECIES: hypothetical protein [Alicyclobacillus]QRF23169.1 hypothetical protein FY534_05400 [Alicyclobacillus sp. TC]